MTLYEVANGLGARRGHHEAAAELCQAVAERCPGRILSVDASLIDSALAIAAEHGLTAYDAA